MCVCVYCAKYKEIPSQATELIWGTGVGEALAWLCLPTSFPWSSGGPDVPVILVSTDLTQWWLWTLLCSSNQVTLAVKCHCTPKV